MSFAGNALHADSLPASAFLFAGETVSLLAAKTEAAPAPGPYHLLRDYDHSGLNFDLGGSETRKLQLQLQQPLLLSMGSQTRQLDNGSRLIGLGATLNMPLTDRFSLSGSAEKQLADARFYSLGSIQCMNGTLGPDSYIASGCRFVNEPLASSEHQRISLGARYDSGKASASIDWFTHDAAISTGTAHRFDSGIAAAARESRFLATHMVNPLLGESGESDPLRMLNREASGVDLKFKVGLTTDTSGDLRLGLAFTRIFDAGYEGGYSIGDPVSWAIAEPFNAGRMNLEWTRGSFSSGIQGFYHDSVNLLDRNSLDSVTTFDVYFTWQTPWKANLTVGAGNVLNAGNNSAVKNDAKPTDPLESIYGRIPYVRYKQDL
ncbi:MAG: hypothetical protein RQ826_00980 [Xanthomonadales bacterium]|nr:hypothetical protein [Xanthomonadales bacterium]